MQKLKYKINPDSFHSSPIDTGSAISIPCGHMGPTAGPTEVKSDNLTRRVRETRGFIRSHLTFRKRGAR